MPASALRSGGVDGRERGRGRLLADGCRLGRNRKQNRELTHTKKAHNAATRYAAEELRSDGDKWWMSYTGAKTTGSSVHALKPCLELLPP
jgi:hypothetical protein